MRSERDYNELWLCLGEYIGERFVLLHKFRGCYIVRDILKIIIDCEPNRGESIVGMLKFIR